MSSLRFLAPLRQRPQLIPLLILVTLVMSGNGLVAPSLSLYAQTFGVGATLVGLLVTLFGVGRLLADVPAGYLAQRLGLKPLLCLGPALIAAGCIGAATADSLTAMLIWRLLQGIGSGVYMTASVASFARIGTTADRGRIMALYQAALLLGTGLGPAIGGWLADGFGLAAPFWAYGLVALAALLLALTGVRETGAARPPPPQADAAPQPWLLSDLSFLLLCILNFAVFFTRTASQFQLIPLLAHDRLGLDLGQIGLALSVMSVASFLVLPLVGWLIDRHGAGPVLVGSSVASGLGLLIVAAAPTVPLFMAGLLLLGLSSGLNGPTAVAHVAAIIPEARLSPAIGLQRAFGDAGFVIGPIAVGLASDIGGAGQTGGLVLTAALMLGVGLALLRVRRG